MQSNQPHVRNILPRPALLNAAPAQFASTFLVPSTQTVNSTPKAEEPSFTFRSLVNLLEPAPDVLSVTTPWKKQIDRLHGTILLYQLNVRSAFPCVAKCIRISGQKTSFGPSNQRDVGLVPDVFLNGSQLTAIYLKTVIGKKHLDSVEDLIKLLEHLNAAEAEEAVDEVMSGFSDEEPGSGRAGRTDTFLDPESPDKRSRRKRKPRRRSVSSEDALFADQENEQPDPETPAHDSSHVSANAPYFLVLNPTGSHRSEPENSMTGLPASGESAPTDSSSYPNPRPKSPSSARPRISALPPGQQESSVRRLHKKPNKKELRHEHVVEKQERKAGQLRHYLSAVLAENPYRFKFGSLEYADSWTRIIDSLVANKHVENIPDTRRKVQKKISDVFLGFMKKVIEPLAESEEPVAKGETEELLLELYRQKKAGETRHAANDSSSPVKDMSDRPKGLERSSESPVDGGNESDA